ncbi:MAG: ankyrin repeat domain-containing protein [Candidatus Dormibacteraeota bacterium]|nr:ankyrin repeat domain-containing protein [Candidatus Dormibacteraeota bacterium]
MALLQASPPLATKALAREDEFFDPPSRLQAYQGHTALHAAAFTYDVQLARFLVEHGADVRARNRRGAEPLHAATMGSPESAGWDPEAQRAIIVYLIGAGADPDAAAAGGITPLHRAVRNRCSAAVEALLQKGADPSARNNHGSTPSDLARWTTGRGGTGSAAAKVEQQAILRMLAESLPSALRS